MCDHAKNDEPFEWGPAKHRQPSQLLNQQQQQQQQQIVDQRDASDQRPDDN